MFSFVNQEKPPQHTINNNTNLIINMNVSHQSGQTAGKQETAQEHEFGDFNAGGENPVQGEVKEQPPKQKNDAWELGSKLFDLDNLTEVKEDKNAMLDKGFAPVLGQHEHIGNNLLHTKGEDLNMLWNAPRMNQPVQYSQQYP